MNFIINIEERPINNIVNNSFKLTFVIRNMSSGASERNVMTWSFVNVLDFLGR